MAEAKKPEETKPEPEAVPVQVPVDGGRDLRVEQQDTNGYLGVAQEYQTYADPTHAPLAAEGDGPEALIERRLMNELDTSGFPLVQTVKDANEVALAAQAKAEAFKKAAASKTPPKTETK
jgi:hypothetical protein